MPRARRSERRGGRMRTRGAAPDRETRDRLIDAGIALFSDRGFHKVTVRDIAREARANIAAVNYHFGDKLGLYREVVRAGIEAVRPMNDRTMRTPPGTSAEDRLRHYVRTYLPNIVNRDWQPQWIQKLMHHEMADPTPAAELIWQEVMIPRLTWLKGVVAELLGPGSDVEDPRVHRAVASIQAQCLLYAPMPFRDKLHPEFRPQDPAQVADVAAYIAEFSLAGIRALAGRG